MYYKYLPPERRTYLSDELLRFTQPGALNDPFECLPGIADVHPLKFMKAIMARNKEDLKMLHPDKKVRKKIARRVPVAMAEMVVKFRADPEFLPRMFLERILNHANKVFGVFSLSKNHKSTLMWSHYATSHSGFCVGFNPAHKFFLRQPGDLRDVGEPVDVEYQAQRKPIDVTNELSLEGAVLYRKSKEWEYEGEVRLIRELKFASKSVILKPFDLHLFAVPHSAIGELICGANVEKSLKEDLVALGHKLGVPVWQSVLSRTTFDMDRTRIS